MRLLLFTAALACAPALSAQNVLMEVPQVSAADVARGYLMKRVPLSHYGTPALHLREQTKVSTSLTEKVEATDSVPRVVSLGMERKQPFALVRVPVAWATTRLRSCTYEVKETPVAAPAAGDAVRTTGDGIHSVLASGAWHKIAVADRGFVRIDYAFFQTHLGVSGSIPSSGIGVFGNGGQMLPERVGEARAADLTENHILVEDGGDGSFGPGDYVVFYAPGTTAWKYNAAQRRWRHTKNLYSDRACYFLTTDRGTGKRLATAPAPGAPTVTVASFEDYAVLNNDATHPSGFGKRWYGDEFGTGPGGTLSRSYTFPLGASLDTLKATVVVGALNKGGTEPFALSINGAPMANISVPGTDPKDHPTIVAKWEGARAFTGGEAALGFSYSPFEAESRGYLDYIELQWRRPLQWSGSTLHFSGPQPGAMPAVGQYTFSGADGSVQVWDVTSPLQPQRVTLDIAGGAYTFRAPVDVPRRFAAFNGSDFLSAESIGAVAAQDLHGTPAVDYVIVTHPQMVEAAERLAAHHREKSGLRVLVATTGAVFNEFSSGSQDLSAIRDFLRYLYDRAGTDTAALPRYLLLFGDASYDYKDRLAGNTNYVPTYEATESEEGLETFSGDDYFGFLDSVESIEDYTVFNTLDIGVGRLPVKNAQEAADVVDKVIRYHSPESLGPWRVATTLTADNEDGAGEHLMHAERMGRTIDGSSPLYNHTKVYVDNLPVTTTPAGERCPDANKAINDAVYRGTFLINYAGHGSTARLAHEAILSAEDFNSWRNGLKLPFMITATCDFSQFDHPEYVSAGEKLVLRREGGAIAMLTTTQAVYSFGSEPINEQFLHAQLQPQGAGWRTFGDAFRVAKNETYSDPSEGKSENYLLNFRKFTLLGDPALQPAFPQHALQTDSVVDMATGERTDGVAALGGYTVHGTVRSKSSGAVLSDFNGTAYVTVYDKPRVVNLRTRVFDSPRSFETQTAVVYKGKVTVAAGRWSCSFVAPKDLNTDTGRGRASLYAENGETDGAGTDTSIRVGGFSENPIIENNPPLVRAFMGDSLFRDGGLTGTSSTLFCILEDETGINVSGSGVGHDLVGVLDGKVEAPYLLNDYYETAPNTYRRGFVRFPVAGLADGRHTLRITAWDMNNNPGEGVVNFEVAGGRVTRIQNLYNYPNPFRDVTRFHFEHNHPGKDVRAQIRIFNTTGALVRTMDVPYVAGEGASNEISWDGTGYDGAQLPKGVYLYQLILSAEGAGEEAAYQKAVLLR